ncbi:MAG TPA: SdpI family protein [Thermoanaerobaculia bacterium]
MSVYEKGLVTILACNALFVLVSLPLVFRKVPRNAFYGYRTRATLGDAFVWYEANAFFGRWFLVASVVTCIAAGFLYRSGALEPGTYLKVSVGLLVAPVLVAALLTSRYIRALAEQNARP